MNRLFPQLFLSPDDGGSSGGNGDDTSGGTNGSTDADGQTNSGGLDAETRSMVEALNARLDSIEKRQSARPLSTTEQIKEQLAEALGIRSEGAQEKAGAKAVTDAADAKVKELADQLRTRELRDHAAAFTDADAAVALMKTYDDGKMDPADVAKLLAERHPSLMKPKKTEPDLSTGGAVKDPGLAQLAKEIADART